MALPSRLLRLFGTFHRHSHKSSPVIALPQRVEFKSQYSLDKIYPESNLDITASPKVPRRADCTFSGFIPIDQLTLTYSRSSGPGGQNVNKVHTKVDLRFHVESAKWLPKTLKPKILEKYQSMITNDGYLVLKSDRTRHQALNVADCLDKLRFMIREADKVSAGPSSDDETARIVRHEKTSRERLRQKRIRSQIKRDRLDVA